jgi:hypothetical protein
VLLRSVRPDLGDPEPAPATTTTPTSGQ